MISKGLYVARKTGLMDAENSSLPSQEKYEIIFVYLYSINIKQLLCV